MQRINTPDGRFAPGDPSAGVKGTVLTSEWANSIQEELARTVERSGQKLNAQSNEQLYMAIVAIARSLVPERVGEIVFELRQKPRPGWLLLNGGELKRACYPQLWDYAQQCGALVEEQLWKNAKGSFSMGDGASTFRLPDLRGEFIRCWADGSNVDKGRSLGSWQDSENKEHAHKAVASSSGEHSHELTLFPGGSHDHSGKAMAAGVHKHISPWGENPQKYHPPWGTWDQRDQFGSFGSDRDNVWGYTSPEGDHEHHLQIEATNAHRHEVRLSSALGHDHSVTIERDGTIEARPTNISIGAFICAGECVKEQSQ